MADLRPFPPSPRRRGLARAAGLHGASAMLVGGVACAAVLIVIGVVGANAAQRLGAWVTSAMRLEPRPISDAIVFVIELVAPVLAAAAIVAMLGHFVQTRAVWMPRRKLSGAPAVEPMRVRWAAFDLSSAIVIGVVAFGWLWLVAPRIAMLTSVPLAGALLVTSAAATLAIAWVAIGVFDALLRYRALTQALFMTAREKREDERLAGIDPRWRAYRTRRRDSDPSVAVAGSSLLVLGDGIAAAIAWDPIRRPTPTTVAAGRGSRATQLLGLARRHRIPVHRDIDLARSFAEEGPIAERHWPRLAEIVAAVRQR